MCRAGDELCIQKSGDTRTIVNNNLQNRAMRVFLGVHRFSPVAGLEGDMAWLAPQFRRWLNMLLFWNRLVSMDSDRLTKKVYDWTFMTSNVGRNNWCKDIYSVFVELGMENHYCNRKRVNIEECKAMLMNKQTYGWLNAINGKPKLRFYATFKQEFCAENYIKLNLSSSERSVLSKLRFGIMSLHIETHVNTKPEDKSL